MTQTFVIPAKAGIQCFRPMQAATADALDSRLRGNDGSTHNCGIS
jgi:hypothetical protein